jgi:Tetrapyrrole (Corrin/Porphyrin) Methylases
MNLHGKQVKILLDASIPPSATLPLISHLIAENACITLFTPLSLHPELETLRRAGYIGVINRIAISGETRAHLCIAAGSESWKSWIQTECNVNCTWKYIVGGEKNITLPEALMSPLRESVKDAGSSTTSPIANNDDTTWIDSAFNDPLPHEAKLYLVGAGPGDPMLLTRQAFHLLTTTPVVITDRLVSPETLALIPSSTKVLFTRKVNISNAGMWPGPRITR